MSAKFSQLRELARQYSAGQVARDEYRTRRTTLIDDITARRTPIDYRDITPPKSSAPPTIVIDVGEDEPESRRVPIIMGAIALVLALGAGGWLVLKSQTAPPAPAVNVAPKNPATLALDEFLTSADWSSAGVAAFEERWDAFDPTLREAAHQDPAFGRLENELRTRIEDQMAVAAVDTSGKADGEAGRLRAFGARMGIEAR